MILDATCGARQIWFQKNEPHTLYCDKRREHFEGDFGSNNAHRVLDISPDMECDFTNMPFPDNTFNLVVLDPPHLLGESGAWLKKAFSFYDSKESAIKSVSDGIKEALRVLKVGGGSDIQVERNTDFFAGNHFSLRNAASIRSQKRQKDEYALDVLHEI